MNRFAKLFAPILSALGLTEKAQSNTLDDKDWAKIESSFAEKYGKSVAEAMKESEDAEAACADRERALALINEHLGGSGDEPTDSVTSAEDGVNRLVAAMEDQNKTSKELSEQLQAIAGRAREDHGSSSATVRLSVIGTGTTNTHLFGIQHAMYSLDKRYNRIAANPAEATLSTPTSEDASLFKVDAREFGLKMAERYRHLQANKMLQPAKLSAGEFATDLTGLKSAGLGDQYVILRQDALIAHILELQDVTSFFPRRSGIQDRELLTNAFFTSVSQAWQPGQVYKGSVELQPEMAYVDDAMVKLFFGPMKEIERKYIGYLNTNGSDPMKWSMIEWYMLNIYRQIVSEQNHRNIRGIYVKPEDGKAGHYLNAGTGVIYTLLRYEHENKMLPFEDKVYNTYTNVTMLDVVKAFAGRFMDVLDVDQDPATYSIYLNARHKHWWMECVRKAYGKDIDFTGPLSYLNVVPDTQIGIKWVPNLGGIKLIMIQQDGNIQLIENIPGEMLSISIDTEMEAHRAWSVWKEGCSATYVGRSFASRDELLGNNFNGQRIFVNKFAEPVAPDATTISGVDAFRFVTGKNTKSTAITDITNAQAGVAYVIEQGTDLDNASTIAKGDKFASITAAYTPTKVGDYIMVVLDVAGTKFLELERRVGGVRKINAALQPNVPGNGVR